MDDVILWQDIGGYSKRKFKKSSIKQWTCKISFGKIDVKLNDKNKQQNGLILMSTQVNEL